MVPAHAWFDPPLLHGDGVTLRPHDDADVPRIVEACRDEDTQLYIPRVPAPPDVYGEEDAIEHLLQTLTEEAAGCAVYWAVTEANGGLLMGESGIFVRDH